MLSGQLQQRVQTLELDTCLKMIVLFCPTVWRTHEGAP